MDTISQDIIQKDRLPLQRNTQLTWIGFSEAMVCVIHVIINQHTYWMIL